MGQSERIDLVRVNNIFNSLGNFDFFSGTFFTNGSVKEIQSNITVTPSNDLIGISSVKYVPGSIEKITLVARKITSIDKISYFSSSNVISENHVQEKDINLDAAFAYGGAITYNPKKARILSHKIIAITGQNIRSSMGSNNINIYMQETGNFYFVVHFTDRSETESKLEELVGDK